MSLSHLAIAGRPVTLQLKNIDGQAIRPITRYVLRIAHTFQQKYGALQILYFFVVKGRDEQTLGGYVVCGRHNLHVVSKH